MQIAAPPNYVTLRESYPDYDPDPNEPIFDDDDYPFDDEFVTSSILLNFNFRMDAIEEEERSEDSLEMMELAGMSRRDGRGSATDGSYQDYEFTIAGFVLTFQF